jgi:hypothetical protein
MPAMMAQTLPILIMLFSFMAEVLLIFVQSNFQEAGANRIVINQTKPFGLISGLLN